MWPLNFLERRLCGAWEEYLSGWGAWHSRSCVEQGEAIELTLSCLGKHGQSLEREAQSLNSLNISHKELNASSRGVQYRVPGILGRSFDFDVAGSIPASVCTSLSLATQRLQFAVVCLVNKRGVPVHHRL